MRSPSRILVVTHTGEIGGAERAMLRLIAAADDRFAISLLTLADGPLVAEARARGIDVRVLDGGEVVRVTRAEAGSLRTALLRGRDGLRAVRTLARVIAAASPDLVVANSLKAAVLIGLAPRRRPPWVWHLHDRISADYLPAAVTRAVRALARRSPRRIVANSIATAATVGGVGPRVVVAYPGIESASFDAPVFGHREGPVGILGRVAQTKGQREFVVAAELIAGARPGTDFRIVGAALFEDAPYADALRAAIAASPVRDSIEWAGWSDDPIGTLREFGILVHASPVPEPFGQVIVEAMAVGTPVVATDAGGVSEILDPDGRSVASDPGVRLTPYGLLVSPGDPGALARAVIHARSDQAGAAERARRAHAHARERFTVERTWEVVARTWTEAIG